MVSIAAFKKTALTFEGTNEEPHFEKSSFRFKKKIFATLDEKINRVCIMLTPADQSTFCTFDKTIVYPVPNKWGLNGATYVELKKVPLDLLKEMLEQAYWKIKQNKKLQ